MILEKLKKHGYSASKIAKELNVNRSAVYQSINGEGSRAIRVKIAAIINEKPSKIWRKKDRITLTCDDLCYLEYLAEVTKK